MRLEDELVAGSGPKGADKPRLFHLAVTGEWWLLWPCAECGGTRLPLARRGSLDSLLSAANKLLEGDCPGCETCRRRACTPSLGPALWYDTLLRDWVVQLPCAGDSDSASALLPLEIRAFDAPAPTVYRAASDLACLADTLAG